MITNFTTKAYCVLIFVLFGLMANAQLKADFGASPVTGCAPLLVSFTDQSTGNPTEWKWDLGNGTISFLQNPSVSYFNPGYYTIKLVVKNDSGADSIVKTQYINVSAKPIVQFTATGITTGCFPLPVQFSDQSTPGSDSISIWQWDFGDGLSSNLQNPLHVYNTAGTFNVTLRVINNKGCLNTLSKTKYVIINPAAVASFSNNVPKVCSAPVTINFLNTTTGAGPLTYQWLFGDSTSSALLSPSHVYTSPGTYSLMLIVTNSFGCIDTLSKPNAFTVGNVSTAFTIGNQVCAGTPLSIVNTSKPVPASVAWTFGDGTSSTQMNPVKSYTTAGTYQIKLLVDFGSCFDSAFKTVTVIPRPTAIFTAGDTNNCSYPFTVNFTSNSLNAVSYQWNFGDNTTSTLASPAHIYNSYGSFKVQLIVTSANGCTDTLRKINHVRIIKPDVVFKNMPDSGCVPFTKSFSTTTAAVDPVTSYFWDFGDGSTGTGATPSHTYTTAGVFPVKVIITTGGGCSDTTIMTKGIVTNGRPVPAFSATPRETCAKTAVVFKDATPGSVIKWLWNFGDGSTSTAQNPQHVYNNTGYFDVQLIAWNSGCPDTVIYKQYVHINPPIARYTYAFDCKNSLTRVFTDNSIGADEWNWSFGDGSTSTLLNPVHTFALPGSYTVSLLVRNHTTGCEFTVSKTIRVLNVTAAFFASDTVICKGSSIGFTSSLTLADVKSFYWDFGDGKSVTSTTSNATAHLYTASGNYTVRLITTDILGCKDTLTKTSYIRIDGPTAKFASSVPGTCLNNLVTFNDASAGDNTNPIKTWAWNYGDGNTEVLSAPPFIHYYTTPGVYIVRLLVTDSKGCTDSMKLTTALIVSKPLASFTTPDTASCPTKQISFTNTSTGPSLSYLWSFGDGATSITKDPKYNYLSDGVYTVKLAIRDQFGCTDSISKQTLISIISPTASFTMSDSFSVCPPLIVQFTNYSLSSVKQNWDFGDGSSASIFKPQHFYSYPGIYTVTLTVTGNGGCTSVTKKNIEVRGPKGTFTYDPIIGCNPVKVNFIGNTQDSTSFVWDFNDGTTIKTPDSIISHIYTNPGIYLPKMILVDKVGCEVPIRGKDTIIVNGVTADFSFLDKPLCDKGNISFINASVSNDVITANKWIMGDGGTSTAKNLVYPYKTTGIFYPKLIVSTLHGCIDSMLSTIPVKVVASPQITISGTANGCTPLAVTFKGLETVKDTSKLTWSWTFVNGTASALQNPAIQNYTVAGIYNTTAIATNSSGCSGTATKSIEAYLIPTVYAGRDTTICNRVGITLQATGASSYSWTPAKGLSCTNCASPVATPDSARNYFVKGTSAQGCSANDTVLVKVQYPFALRYSNPDTLCKGQTVKLFASGTDRFQWTPSSSLDNGATATPTGSPDTTTTYRVIGTDYLGCFKDTGFVFVKVYPIPTVNAGADKTINTGQTLDLVPVISADVSKVTWSPTGSIFRSVYPGISVKPSQTTEYRVDVKNGGGCLASDRVTVFVICNGSNVFIPNTFSPNGDGANDVFYPRGSGLFKIKTLRIFNRWGEIVFEKSSFNANDPSSGWDGTYKGTRLADDAFVYMIDIICDNNSVLTYKGNVALLR